MVTPSISIPDVLPVTSKTYNTFNQIKLPELSREVTTTKSAIQDSVIALIMASPEYPEQKVQQMEKAYRDLLIVEAKQRHLNAKLIELKSQYKEQSNDLPRLDRDNWNNYLNNDYNLVNMKKQWQNSQSDAVEIDSSDQWLRVFYALPNIWTDPTRVIPFDPLINNGPEEEEDLKVDGGVIELTCPVSLQKFKNPMISLKCFHTFDNESLKSLFRSTRTIECPIPGCGKPLTTRDFVEDRLMQIRVLISDVRK